MHTKVIVGTAVALSLALAGTASAQTKRRHTPPPTRGEPAACAALHQSYDMVGKKLAWAKVQGDMGGARARLEAEQQATTIMSGARIAMDLLRSNRCKSPTAAPNRDGYLSQALQCHTALLTHVTTTENRFQQPPACKMEDWQAR